MKLILMLVLSLLMLGCDNTKIIIPDYKIVNIKDHEYIAIYHGGIIHSETCTNHQRLNYSSWTPFNTLIDNNKWNH